MPSRNEIFSAHLGGKIEVNSKRQVTNDADLAVVYTPGVAEVCTAIAADKNQASKYTIKKNTVAVFSNGTAVLGLGDIGPHGAIPVMEGKAMLFKNLAGVDAFPICIHGKTVDEVVNIAKAIEPVFAGFNLEDIAAPECFEIEKRLQDELDVPVMHDDQHGTAVVSLAALLNSLKIVKKDITQIKVVISGAGAAGVACSKLWLKAGLKSENLVICDTKGAIYEGRKNSNDIKQELAKISNTEKIQGSLKEVLVGADVFLGVSGPNLLLPVDILKMNSDAIVFGLSNPIPEFDPIEAKKIAAVVATGRSDYANQVNNVLVFPGFFKGLLSCGAKKVTDQMKLKAAYAIADLVTEAELNPEYILPKALDPRVVKAVADAVSLQ